MYPIHDQGWNDHHIFENFAKIENTALPGQEGEGAESCRGGQKPRVFK